MLDERTAPEERELPLPVITRTEELRLEPLSIRRVAPLPEWPAVVPVRDALDAELRFALPVCVSRRVADPATVRWLGKAFGPPHPGLPTPKPG